MTARSIILSTDRELSISNYGIAFLKHRFQMLKHQLHLLRGLSNQSNISLHTSLDNIVQSGPIETGDQLNSMLKQLWNLMFNSYKKTSRDVIEQKLGNLKRQLRINPDNQKAIEKWVGELIKIAIEQAKIAYFEGGDEEEMRLTFATLILEQRRKFTLELSKLPGINQIKLEEIFKNTSDYTIEYLQCQFEASKGSAVDPSLGNIIKETAKTLDTEYDLLRRSRTQINIRQKRATVSSIKAFLNKLINECQMKSPMFKEFVDRIFKVGGEIPMNVEYGSKIKMSTPTYTEDELHSEGFFVTGNEIMRVLMKWIEELLDILKKSDRLLEGKGKFKVAGQHEMVTLSNKQREFLWRKVSEVSGTLKAKMDTLKEEIKTITSQIILASECDIPKYEYLDKNVLNMLMISENIWIILENYMMDTLTEIFSVFSSITDSISESGDQIMGGLQIHTFMLGDLLRCRGHGTKEQVLEAWRNLEREEGEGTIKILRVKNRLSQATSDFLVNFAFKDEKKCFLICEMQIGLKKGKNEESQSHNYEYHFMHFLYEMARSPHGVVVELAVMLYSLDNRKKFIQKHCLKMKPPKRKQKFVFKEEKVMCTACQKHVDTQKNKVLNGKDKTYMCCNCYEVVPSCKYSFDPYHCPNEQCLNILCPICYLGLIPQQAVNLLFLNNEILFSNKNYLKDYFKPIKGQSKFRMQAESDILDIINENLENEIVAILYFKDYFSEKHVEIIMKIQKDNQDYYLKFGTNKLFNIKQELSDSIFLILKPTLNPKKQISLKVERLSSIEANSLSTMRNESIKLYKKISESDKGIVVGEYSEQKVEEEIADQKMKNMVENINRKHQILTKLFLIKIRSTSRLNDIKFKDHITDVEIEEQQFDLMIEQQHQFNYLKMFPKIMNLSVHNTSHFRIPQNSPFDKTLKQLVITQSNLSSQHNYQNYFPLLEKLDLSNNNLELIPNFKFEKVEYINISNNNIKSIQFISFRLQRLRRIIAKNNQIKDIPVLDLPSLQHLYLNNNKIESFANIRKFKTKNLKYVDLSNNFTNQKQLFNIDNLPNLSNFILSNCNIIKLNILHSNNLKVLKLDHNLLEDVRQLERIEFELLDLSYNKIDKEGLNFILQRIQADVVELYGNYFDLFPDDTNFQPKVVIFEASKFNCSKLFNNIMPRNSKNYKKYRPPVCNTCGEEIKDMSMWYNMKKNVKICNNDADKQEKKNEEIIELVKVRGQKLEDFTN